MNSLKLQDSKRDVQMSVAFLYANNKLQVIEIILFTVASKGSKYLGINLTKEVRDLYTDNYKTLMSKTGDRNKWNMYSVLIDFNNNNSSNVHTT